MQIRLWIDVVELDNAVAFLKAQIVPIISMCVDAVHDGVLDAETKALENENCNFSIANLSHGASIGFIRGQGSPSNALSVKAAPSESDSKQ